MSELKLEFEEENIIQKQEKNQVLFTAVSGLLKLMDTFNPIEKDNEGHIHFNPKMMVLNQYYPFKFKEKEYLLKKSADKVIDIYEIKD